MGTPKWWERSWEMRLCPHVPVIPSLPLTATLFWTLSPPAAERPEWALRPQLSCLEDSLQAWSKGIPWAPPQAPGIVSPSLSPLPQEVQALQPGIPERPQNTPIPSSRALGHKPAPAHPLKLRCSSGCQASPSCSPCPTWASKQPAEPAQTLPPPSRASSLPLQK